MSILKESKNEDESYIEKEEWNSIEDNNKSSSWLMTVLNFSWEIIKTIAISLAIILPIRYFVIQPFYVKGASMEPNFYDNEYLIINELSYRFKNPERGDIIVFQSPLDKNDFFIKRIIGLPNERVKVTDNGIYVYNSEHPEGALIEEEYLPKDDMIAGDYGIIRLGNDEYYVLGDNRGRSLDSRFFGAINKKSIVGRVWLRGWPFNRVKIFSHEKYNLK